MRWLVLLCHKTLVRLDNLCVRVEIITRRGELWESKSEGGQARFAAYVDAITMVLGHALTVSADFKALACAVSQGFSGPAMSVKFKSGSGDRGNRISGALAGVADFRRICTARDMLRYCVGTRRLRLAATAQGSSCR
jgi:hypothetical protein